ncbi:AlbA family DNA-binding domain-containing protein [Algoriphagus limi]|uniref:ATP-binding protein n=1 Tax=Algoriphagus limi TaxID=2975273 RepID=A0ABT2G2X2_9BACT|nr:ATP-binding protein [Algoriphagus limi]MCS5489585.1 ATP-binding protein [Algoriphagus limi]
MNKDKFENFDPETFQSLLKSKEDTRLDRKLKITSREKIAKTIAAMANTEGGQLLVGISDHGKLIGIDPEEEMYMIRTANEKYCHPPAKLSFRTIQYLDYDTNPIEPLEKYFLIVGIAKSPGINCFDKKGNSKYYVRKNDRTVSVVRT